jgi:hypothetical protein
MSGSEVSPSLPGEQIIWSGTPAGGLLLTSRDWFVIPFSLFFGGMMISVFLGGLLSGKADAIALIWLLPFVLVGLHLIAGRFFLDAWLRRRTSYAVTNKRILISRSAPFGTFTSIRLDRLPDMTLSESSGGRGTIRFGSQQWPFGFGGFSGMSPALDPTPQFLAIENARRVFDQIERTAASVR